MVCLLRIDQPNLICGWRTTPLETAGAAPGARLTCPPHVDGRSSIPARAALRFSPSAPLGVRQGSRALDLPLPWRQR
jgi:hypothetical protein